MMKAVKFALYGMVGCVLGSIVGEGCVIPFVQNTAGTQQEAFIFSPEVQERLDREGAKTGDIQIALKWDNYNDLDLHCIDPNGDEIYYSNKRVSSGGELDVDMNAGGQKSLTPVENIYWASGAAPTGHYRLYVDHYANKHSATSAFEIEAGVLGQGTKKFTGQVTHGQSKSLVHEFYFSANSNAGAGTSFASFLLIGLWTALLAIGLSLALIAGQNRYMRRKPVLTKVEIGKASIGGLVFGLIAGGLGQCLYLGSSYGVILEALSKMVSWTILGGFIGFSLSTFIPNLPPLKGLIGGLIGGFIGAFGFIIGAAITGDVFGRWLGAAIIGFCIGLMIAIIEQLTREAALEVTWAPNETSLISLGERPITIGGGKEEHIFIAGMQHNQLKIKLEQAKIICEDTVKKKTTSLKNDSKLNIGSVQIKVLAN